jgi:hypothetical protein
VGCGNLVKNSDLQASRRSSGDGVSILRNGKIGEIDRFTIYQSRSLLSADLARPGCSYVHVRPLAPA